MNIIVDSREQLPLVFKHKSIKETVIKGLSVGDYGAIFDDGFEPPMYFERKSVADLYGTLSKGYSRFKLEFERAKQKNLQLIIIVEKNLTGVLNGTPYSMRTPESIVYQVFTIFARYGIQTIFCKDREDSAEYITQFFIAHEKEYLDRKSQCAIT